MLRIPIKCDGKPVDGDKRGSRDMIRFSFCTGLSGEDKEWTMGRAARRYPKKGMLVTLTRIAVVEGRN